MTKRKIPKIFEMATCLEVVEVGTYPSGDPYMRLDNARPDQEVGNVDVIYTVWRRRKRIVYSYSVRHPGGVVEEYHGPHGDPNRDEGGPFLVIEP